MMCCCQDSRAGAIQVNVDARGLQACSVFRDYYLISPFQLSKSGMLSHMCTACEAVSHTVTASGLKQNSNAVALLLWVCKTLSFPSRSPHCSFHSRQHERYPRHDKFDALVDVVL